MNKVFIKGRLTVTPEQRFIRDEVSVVRFGVAVDRKIKKGEEKQTDFINIVAWNKLGEFVKNYFDKGQEILIIGRLETNQYVDKDSQKKLTSYSVVAEEIEFCGKKEKQEKKEKITEDFDFTPSSFEDSVNMVFSGDDDLPF